MWTSISEEHILFILMVENQLSEKAVCSMLVQIQTTQCYIPEDGNINKYHSENLIFYKTEFFNFLSMWYMQLLPCFKELIKLL
jgi:hypothetical protein